MRCRLGMVGFAVAVTAAAPAVGQPSRSAVNAAEEVCKQAQSDPRMRPLAAKMRGFGQPSTLQMLSDSSLPTEEEKQALLLYDEVFRSCDQARNHAFSSFGLRELAAGQELLRSQQRLLMANLFSGDITFGDYNKFMERASGEWRATVQRVRGALEAKQVEEARRLAQQKAQELRSTNQTILEKTRRSTYTSTACRSTGGGNFTCDSYAW